MILDQKLQDFFENTLGMRVADWPDEYAALTKLIEDEVVAELKNLEYVDWESYGDTPRTKYDTGINELIDPLVENYFKTRIAELEAGRQKGQT